MRRICICTDPTKGSRFPQFLDPTLRPLIPFNELPQLPQAPAQTQSDLVVLINDTDIPVLAIWSAIGCNDGMNQNECYSVDLQPSELDQYTFGPNQTNRFMSFIALNEPFRDGTWSKSKRVEEQREYRVSELG